MQRLKQGHRIALLGKQRRAGQAGRAGADDSDLDAIGLSLFRHGVDVLAVPVGDKALQTADGDRLALHAAHALGLALRLLRTDTAGERGQRVRGGDDLIGRSEIALGDLGNELGDADVDRAAADAGHLRAVETAERLVKRGLFGIACCNLVKVVCAYFGCLGGHFVLFGAHVRHIILPPC